MIRVISSSAYSPFEQLKAYTRHVYVNRRETPVASSLASTINFKDLFEDSMPLDEPAGPAYFKRRSSDLFAVRPDELAGVDMEANPPEIDAGWCFI